MEQVVVTGAAEPTPTDTYSTVEERFRRQVAEDYQVAKNALRKKHDLWLEAFKRYRIPEDIDRAKIGMASVAVPLINEAVNVIQADMIAHLFKTTLNIDTIGRESNDQPFARVIRDMIKYQTYVTNTKAKLSDAIFSFLLYGMSPGKVCYREKWSMGTQQQPVLIPGITDPIGYDSVRTEYLAYKGAFYEPLDVFDFFPHPDKIDIDDDAPICHRFYPSPAILRERERNGIYRNVQLVLNALKESGVSRDGEGQSTKQTRREAMGMDYNLTMEQNYPECIEWQGRFDINDDGYDERVIGTIAYVGNEPILLRFSEDTYNMDESHYVCGRLFRVPGEFMSIGLGEMLISDEKAATSLLRAMLDSYYRMARPRTTVIEGALVDENELKVPFGTVHINETDYGQDALRELPAQPIGQDGYALLSDIKNNSKARSAVADMMAGRIPGQKTTATVGSQAFNQASNRFRHLLWLFEDSVIVPMCRKMHKINQQFIDKEYAVMVLGEDGVYWNTVTPQQISADINFISLASSAEADKQIAIEQLMRAIQVANSSPMTAPTVVPLFVQLLETFDVRNLDMFKTMLGYEQMVMQAKMAAQQGITPQQMLAMQGMLFQQQYNPRNTTAYGGEQEQTPTNQEELMAKTNQSMTQNFPVAR